MKKSFHKVISIVMTMAVLFSTLSFTINMHYCGENLVDTAIFSKSKSCGMESEMTKGIALQLPGCSITNKNCCSDRQQTISGQDELQLNLDKTTLGEHLFVAAFLHTYLTLFEISERDTLSLKAFPPPLVNSYLYKLDESYLI